MPTRTFVEVGRDGQIVRMQERNSAPRIGEWLEITGSPHEKDVQRWQTRYYVAGGEVRPKCKISIHAENKFFDTDNPAVVHFENVPEHVNSFKISVKGEKIDWTPGEPLELSGSKQDIVEIGVVDPRVCADPIVVIGKRKRNAHRPR